MSLLNRLNKIEKMVLIVIEDRGDWLVMNRFMYVFNEKDKKELIYKGFTFIREVKFNNKIGYMFINNEERLDSIKFNKNNIMFSNKMNF